MILFLGLFWGPDRGGLCFGLYSRHFPALAYYFLGLHDTFINSEFELFLDFF